MNEQDIIEQRLQIIKNFYLKVDKLFDAIPDAIPDAAKSKIKDLLLSDSELKEFIEGIDSHRPPRIFLAGRTGIGKSSLINAIYGAYKAQVSDTSSCTRQTKTYPIKSGDTVKMEICDTRGTKESLTRDDEVSAEEVLINDICAFSPDIAIYLLDCSRPDDVLSDVFTMKKLCDAYQKRNSYSLPLVIVLNKCDDVQPDRFKEPDKYPVAKIKNINDMIQQYTDIVDKSGLAYLKMIAVSSYIEWQTADGEYVSSDDIEKLPISEVEKLEIHFDGRYNIEELTDFLLTAIPDPEARMGLLMASKLTEVVRRMANHLCRVFSSIAVAIAATPILVHDIIPLSILQAILVSLIAALSGRNISIDTAKEFVASLLGIGGLGFSFRLIAQEASKLLNFLVPGAGSAVSATIAAGGTNLIGKMAIDYYIKEIPLEEVKQHFKTEVKKLI